MQNPTCTLPPGYWVRIVVKGIVKDIAPGVSLLSYVYMQILQMPTYVCLGGGNGA